MDDYDLEILTNDWTQYDANKAIVRTSALGPDDILRFVRAFDEEVERAWQVKLRGYREGTNTPLDNLRVEGHFRTRLVFRLLSEDLIELHGTFSGRGSADETIPELCRRIEAATDTDPRLVDNVIRDFVSKGFVKARKSGEHWNWYWTHNRYA